MANEYCIMDVSAGTTVLGDVPSDIVAFNAVQQAEAQTPMRQLLALEAEITPRRLREAVLGLDGGWLANKEQQIAALRAQL